MTLPSKPRKPGVRLQAALRRHLTWRRSLVGRRKRAGHVPTLSPARLSSWEAIIGWFMHNPLVVVVLTLLVLGAGLRVAPFDWKLGSFPRDPVPVDAIPDIGENQQIVFTEWPGRSPTDIDNQVTYPLTTALLGIPGVRTVRSSSAFGFSTIYLIFEDNVEFYWSRSRVLEKLTSLTPGTLPVGVTPTLGPDATALGQVFWYTLEGQDAAGNTVGGWDPDELRSIQDWTVRYALQSVPGVSEVASIGGFVREYQVDVDPEAMRAAGVTLGQVASAVRNSNLDVGARTLEINQVEYVVRGLGFVRSLDDLEATVVTARGHTPIRIRDVAHVGLGPALRRGALDDAGAPAVGGIVVARFLENPLHVIEGVKKKISEIQAGLPRRTVSADGSSAFESQVKIVPFYDRTTLIQETLGTLSTALFQQILITVLVVLVMLRDVRSSLLVSLTLPMGVLAAFVAMKWTGVDANIMALAGIAIAIGTMVDIAIVFVESMNRQLEELGPATKEQRAAALRHAAAVVAPAVLTSVLTTVVSFLPVFGLSSAELRLFAPLAYTKTFAMLGALALAVLVLPALSLAVLRPRPEPLAGVTSGMSRVVASLFRAQHVRDWLLVGLGLIVGQWSVAAGLLVVAFGVFRLARPLLPSTWVVWATRGELVWVVLLVTVLLTRDWMPLGKGRDEVTNLIFVAIAVFGVLATFRLFEWAYPQLLGWVLEHKATFLLLPLLVVGLGLASWLGVGRLAAWMPAPLRQSAPMVSLAQAFPGLGREYMPPFDEGSYLYMPTTMPHASIGQALDMISHIDAAIAQIPEVERVVGKLGRADTALDPAPVSMIETIVTYKPEYSEAGDGTRTRLWRDHVRSTADIWDEIVQAAQYPGLTSAPVLMPIGARLVMLQSGMRAPMGIKVRGPSLEVIDGFGLALEDALKQLPILRSETVFADRVVGKPYLEINIDREAIGRYGLSIVDVQQVLQVALGGMTLTQTVEGRERYPVRVRYMREERDSVEALERVFVATPSGDQIPLTQLATLRYVRGPQMIKSEDTFLTSYVLFDKVAEIAEVEAVDRARAYLQQRIDRGALVVPAGVSYDFAGSYENQVRSERRLVVLVPVALALVFLLLYLQFQRVLTTLIIYSGVAVAVSGGFLLLWLYAQPSFLDFTWFGASMRELFQVGPVNLSVAVWVGFIALVGVATDDGVVMSTYLDQRFRTDPPHTVLEVRARTLEAGLRRVRPCLMTTATTLLALLPVVTSSGRGADIMVPMALPALGGMTIALLTLFVVPVLYSAVEERRVRRLPRGAGTCARRLA